MAIDASGNLYISTADYVIRKVTPQGIISTIAGTPGLLGYTGDFGPSSTARIGYISAMVNDPAGHIFLSDRYNNLVRVLIPQDGEPLLSVVSSHNGILRAGQSASFTIEVKDVASTASSGLVTVSDLIPSGVGFVSLSGTGWFCSGAGSCTRNDSLASGQSYPPISLVISIPC